MRLRKRMNVLAALATMLLIQACTGSPTTNEASSPTQGTGTEQGGTLIVAMTSSDLPTMDVVPSQGLEAYKFVGFQLYDGLVNFDPLAADEIVPGLAKSWEVDGKKWTFHLREGVKFHDGSPWNADAAVFNLDRLIKKDSPDYNANMSALNSRRTRSIDIYRKIDDLTLEIYTKEVDGFILYELPYILFASPEAVRKHGDAYEKNPSGTGPFKFVEYKERQYTVMASNKEYWKEPAKLDQLIVRPMQDPASRYAALRSGEIHLAEVPPPDAIPEIKQSGFQVVTKPYAHIWFYQPNMSIPPFHDVRVREAFALAIDKEGLCENLLNGACAAANGPFFQEQKWYPKDAKTFEYNPEKAKQLLAEAGYPDGVDLKIQMPSSGSGNMWPLPMAEYIQMNLAQVGFRVKFDVYDWSTISNTLRGEFPSGVHAIEMSRGMRVPSDFERNFITPPPGGSNNMGYNNEELSKLITEVKNTVDVSKQDELLLKAAKLIQDDVAYLPVVHDLNLRALSPKVKGFEPPSSWFADFRGVWVEK